MNKTERARERERQRALRGIVVIRKVDDDDDDEEDEEEGAEREARGWELSNRAIF